MGDGKIYTPLKSALDVIRSCCRDAAGHSLVEVVVATSLVLTVLVPLSGLAVYLLTVRPNAPYLEALTLGERYMEQTLYERSYASGTERLDGGRWRVEKTASTAGQRVTISVRVFRRNRPEPLVELMTVRLLP